MRRRSSNYFDVLGIQLARGRGFSADEDKPGSNTPVVVASDLYWKRNGANPDQLGQTIRVNERPFTVIGIPGS